jgi:hypothetical protein
MNEMDALFPNPTGQRNADDMGAPPPASAFDAGGCAPPVIASEGTTEAMQDPRLVSHVDATPPAEDQPAPPAEISPHDFPGLFVELREDEVAVAFPGGLPVPGGIYGLLCTDVYKGEGEQAGKFGVGFRYVKVAEIKGQPGSRIIVPNR